MLEMLTKTRPFAPRGDHDEAAALDRTRHGEFGWGEYENKVRFVGSMRVRVV